MTLGRAALAAQLRAEAFGPAAAGPPRIGAEVELIPVETETGAVVPVQSEDGLATLPLLRRFGAAHGWREEPSPYGVPRFVLPDGAIVSYEPGGQVELSAAPASSVHALVRALRGVVVPLTAFFGDAGVALRSVGIEPRHGVDEIPLQLPGTRYVRLTRFMEWLGTGGTRMMRQTASFQVSLDWGASPLARWRLLNALAPYVTAVFASSPVYRGRETGHRSFRAHVWRELDGGRTGIFPCGADPVEEYLAFALAAPVILHPRGDGFVAFSALDGRGEMTMDDWRTHLTTLFPDVRPKGFAEVRACDAVDAGRYAAPLVFLAGLAYDARSAAETAALLGAPDAGLLVRAGRDGLRDPEIASVARDLVSLAIEGARRLGPSLVSGAALEEAVAFFDAYTRRGRDPGDDVSLPSASPATDELSTAAAV